MGIISLEKQDHLFWLGRYCERAYTTIHTFLLGYDRMLDDDSTDYKSICKILDIPDIYKDEADFIKTYVYDGNDVNSIFSNLKRAYDNAIVLRDEISSVSLSYIQMALDAMEEYSKEPFSLLQLQRILDLLLAFWGSVDVYVFSDNSRDIIKGGRSLERLDLCIRLGYPAKRLTREFHMFETRMHRLSAQQYNAEAYQQFCSAFQKSGDLKKHLVLLNQIFVRR